MKKRNYKNITNSIFIVAVFLLAGCASTGTIHPTSFSRVSLSDYRSVKVSVSSEVSDSAEEVAQLENLLLAKLRNLNRFEKVVSGLADISVDLELRTTITKLKKVGAGKRLFLGILAGQASVIVRVELVNAEGISVGSFDAEGKSSGGSAFAGTTSDAVEKVSEQIVLFVQENI